MTHEYNARRTEPYPDRSAIDAMALRFIKSWHRHPDLHDLMWYKGVNLGEMDEYDTLPEVIAAIIENEGPAPS